MTCTDEIFGKGRVDGQHKKQRVNALKPDFRTPVGCHYSVRGADLPVGAHTLFSSSGRSHEATELAAVAFRNFARFQLLGRILNTSMSVPITR